MTGHNVDLAWNTISSSDVDRYEIQQLLKGEFQTIATINDAATLNKTLRNMPAGTHVFRVISYGRDGSKSVSAAIEVNVEMPGAFELSEAYPNPFNPMTRFTLTVAQTQNVRVEVFNMLGQKVATLFNGQAQANEVNTLTFDANNLPSGTYLYRAVGANFVAMNKVVLLK